MNAFTFLSGGAGANWLAQGGTLLAQADGGVSFNLVATFSRAELFGKIIVILLLFCSLLAWTVMIGKYLDLDRWRKLNLAFQAKLKQSGALMEANVSPATRQSGPYARLFYEAVQAGRQHRADGDARVRMGLIENALQRGVAQECVQYETRMVVLGSLVSGAPFIGLLGTVWGVMVAFSAMGVSGSTATVQNMAPGVASARTMPRHAALYRKPRPRTVVRHRRWRAAAAARWRYPASRYSPYRYFHYHYRWYVVFIPRCGCH